MRTNRFVLSAITALSGVLGIVALAAAQHQHSQPGHGPTAAQAGVPEKGEQALKVGKKDEVEFKVETVVGETRLKPGHYQLQHRVDGSDHFVRFIELAMRDHFSSGAAKGDPSDVKCRLETIDKKAEATSVYTTSEGDARRVTKVLVRGENVAHLF